MAWKTFTKTYSAGQQATVFADYCAFAVTAGWSLWDDVSASCKVFRSNGESGTLMYGYLQVDYDATYLYFRAFIYWDRAAHVGYGQAYYDVFYNGRKTANTAGVKRLYGNKDLLIYYTLDSTYYLSIVGHFNGNPFSELPLATLTADVLAGASVVVPVDTTEGLPINSTFVIVDPATGMRQGAQVIAINPGVSLTIAALANGYTTGSKIGWNPIGFAISGDQNIDGYSMAVASKSSTGNGVNGANIANFGIPSGFPTVQSPTGFGLYSLGFLQAHFLDDVFYLGMLPEYIRTGGGARNAILAVRDDRQFIVYSATSGSSNTLADTARTWTVNELAGKSAVVVGGTGLDQSRVILSNTATEITVRDNWATAPTLGSTYIIADRSYLMLYANHLLALENEA
jgi:hypothetical protein